MKLLTKAQMIEKLTAAGVTVPEGNHTVASLTELAAANGISVEVPGQEGDGTGSTPDTGTGSELPPVKEKIARFTAPADPDAEEIGWRVAAGLTEAQAREVIGRQRAEDAAKGK